MRDATFRIRSRRIEVLWFFYRLISARAVDYQQEDRYGDRNASTVPDTDEWPPPTLPVNPGDYSYVVYVHAMGKQNEYFEACMGSLISPLFVLSLARCTYQVAAPNIRVTHGNMSSVHQHRYAQRTYSPKRYNKTSKLRMSIISLHKLQKPFNGISSFVRLSSSLLEFDDGKVLNCRSFGSTYIENAKNNYELDFRTYNVSAKFGSSWCGLNEYDRDKEFLRGESLIDVFDDIEIDISTGGPLICDESQYGVFSYYSGYNCSYYVAVHKYVDWINEKIHATVSGTTSNSLSAIGRVAICLPSITALLQLLCTRYYIKL